MSGQGRGGRSRRPRGGGGPGDVRQPLPHPAHTMDGLYTSVARLLGSGTHRYRMVATVVEPPVLPDPDLLLKLQDPDPRV